MQNKIILMGSHGLGKTTALNQFKEQGYIIFPEIIREIIRQNTLNADRKALQHLIFTLKQNQHQAFYQEESLNKIVMDRCHIDVLLYDFLFFSDFLQNPASKQQYFNILEKSLEELDKDHTKYIFFLLSDQNRDWIKNDKDRLPFELDSYYIGEFREQLNQLFVDLYSHMQTKGFDVKIWEYKE